MRGGGTRVEGGMALTQEVAVMQVHGGFVGSRETTLFLLLECSVRADSTVNPLLWERGKKKVEKQRESIFSLSALVPFQNTYLRNIFLHFLLL